MRTTIHINDRLLALAKQRAAETHSTLTSVIEDALRLALENDSRKPQADRVRLPVYGSGGLKPGVNLNNNAALLDLLEDRE